jgi:hypothetical protein
VERPRLQAVDASIPVRAETAGGHRVHPAVAFLLFSALAILWTWPLSATLSTRVLHDPGDPILNTWILWWNAQRVPFTEAWWNAPFMAPMPGAFALSEHLVGLSVLATPLQWAGARPIEAYNVSVLLSYALSGFFASLLGWRLTGSLAAAFFTGLAFAFAPYRAGQLAHIQVLTSQWMPAMLLAMHAYMDDGRRRWLVWFGVAWLLQALSNGYYLLFWPALIVPWLLWFTPWRTAARRGVMLGAAWAIASLPLLPALWKYHQVHSALGLARSLGDIRQFSATWSSFLNPPAMLRWWPSVAGRSQEDYLFPGLTVAVLTVAGLGVAVYRWRRNLHDARIHALVFYSLAAVLMAALAMGPGGQPDGPPSLLRPYSWLLSLPGYDGLRVPSRFAMLTALCLSISAGLALAALTRARAFATAIAIVACAGAVVDSFLEPVPIATPPPRIALDQVPPDAMVIEIPVDDLHVSVGAMYRSINHRHSLINGYTGHIPPHYAILGLALRRGDTSVLTSMARLAPLAIVVNPAADQDGDFRKMIEEIRGVSLLNVSAAGPIFLLPRQPPPPPAAATVPVSCSAQILDARRVQLDCSGSRTINGIGFALRGRYRNLAERMLVEASDDGNEWREVWRGWTGEFALEGALVDPLVAPVRIPIPETHARLLRIYPADPWLATELQVISR